MIISSLPNRDHLRQVMNDAYRMDETECLERLIAETEIDEDDLARIATAARKLVVSVRNKRMKTKGLDSFLTKYDLSSEEGIALMCLAEALLRVPDKDNIDRLIRDKVGQADWQAHISRDESITVNAATWALMLTGKVLSPSDGNMVSRSIKKIISRTGEPVIRSAVGQAMKIMSRQFVMGRTIEEAIERGREDEKKGYRHSYDMLGEAARTAHDAERYYEAYLSAIESIGQHATGATIDDRPGISIKLSALHPRYEANQYQRVVEELTPRVFQLAKLAKDNNIQLTIDAEEADRLDLSLDIFESVIMEPALNGWDGFGLALQSYQKRAWYLIDWLADVANRSQHKIRLRLIKGAYWDSEVKQCQLLGLSDYPVFTRKNSTDVSFTACLKKLLEYPDQIYPQIATHNAYSVACALELMGDHPFEFQALHGMGKPLYDEIVGKDKYNIPCRIYSPVGSHEDLLPYLVRRLLENGANTSFVNRIVDADAPLDDLVVNPLEAAEAYQLTPHPKIPKATDIFKGRRNSQGIDFSDHQGLKSLAEKFQVFAHHQWQAGPIINGQMQLADPQTVYSPQSGDVVGKVSFANEVQVEQALESAQNAFKKWQQTDVNARADILEKIADLYEENQIELMALAIREAGKTVLDAHNEVREAVDFCRYYAAQAREKLAEPVFFEGYTGETNHLSYHGRGVFVCISPWNFPLAIFTGQVVGALVSGNCVIAKPAEQTNLIATFAVKLCHQAGIPTSVLQYLPGAGEIVGAKCVADHRCKGVMFTGSTETARAIDRSLSEHKEIIPFIAETGGQNSMIVDSSALTEQVIVDVVQSAFGSAGQRCSALRVLFVQKEVSKRICTMLKGAMQELTIGDPAFINTDIGPVIDNEAKTQLDKHIEFLHQHGECVYACQAPTQHQGHYVAPQAFKIDSLDLLEREFFGPILHIIEYDLDDLDQVIDSINNTGYGLTLGIHSRINETIAYIRDRVKVGNCYINRNMIGAVVGLQAFGGEGLSGTGPKAGGPNYLYRLCHERVVTVNTTAAGGNASLMSLDES